MQVKAANVVWQTTSFHSEQDFWAETRKCLQQLRKIGVQIALFPGFTGLLHAGSFLSAQGRLPEILDLIATNKKAFDRGFGELAREYGIYLCPGTTVSKRGNRFSITASLFDPRGKKLGEQQQTHLSQQEKAWGLERGEELPVWDTDLGRIGIATGTDIWHPEVSRILALQGAELVLAPAAITGPYNPWLQMAGMWQQVQQNQFFALENWLAGNIFGSNYEGRALILAPCEMTSGETGFLAREEDDQIAELDFSKRKEIIKGYPLLAHLNRPLYQAYLPGLYERDVTNDPNDYTGKSSRKISCFPYRHSNS
jgi:predicted amidohydrolase